MAQLYTLPRTGMTRAAGLYPTMVVGSALCLIWSLWWATQTAASAWGFAPSLGQPIIGRLYYPYMILVWIFRFHWESSAMPIFLAAGKAFLWQFVPGMVLVIGFVIHRAKRYGAASDLRGSAAWGDLAGARRNGLLSQGGLFLGGMEVNR